MNINTPDYKGKCRRSNGKLNLSLKDWIWILVIVIPLFAGGIVGWTKINGKVDAHEEILKDVTPKKMAIVQEKVEGLEEDVAEIKKDVGELRIQQVAMRTEMNTGFLKILTELKNNR